MLSYSQSHLSPIKYIKIHSNMVTVLSAVTLRKYSIYKIVFPDPSEIETIMLNEDLMPQFTTGERKEQTI